MSRMRPEYLDPEISHWCVAVDLLLRQEPDEEEDEEEDQGNGKDDDDENDDGYSERSCQCLFQRVKDEA